MRVSYIYFTFLILLTFILPTGVRAQFILPLGGNISATNQGGGNLIFSVKVLLDKTSLIPDSAFFYFGLANPKNGYKRINSITLTEDSNFIAEYRSDLFTMNGVNMKFTIMDSGLVGLSDATFRFYLSYYSNAFASLDGGIESYLGVIYHRPNEKVRGNPFMKYSGKDSIRFYTSNGFNYSIDKVIPDTRVKTQLGTWDFIYSCETCKSNTTIFPVAYGDYIEQFGSLYLKSDSSLTGTIEIDTSKIQPSGFIVYEPDDQDTINVQFKYIDSTAQNVQVLSYSTLSRFGTDISTVTSVKSGDTTTFTCKHLIPEDLKKHLPGSVIYHLIVKLNDGRTIRRMVSMIIKNQRSFLTGISKITQEDKIKIYPNPVSGGMIHVNTEGHYIVTNCIGKVIMNGLTKGDIQFESLDSGIYFLTISNDNGIQSLKIIKN